MLCPVCKKHTMETAELAPGLSGLQCTACAGTWIPRSNYDAWRARLPAGMQEINTPAQIGNTEARQGKLCPQCGHLLLPYKVGHGLSFAIDYCSACGGVWFDRGEWEAILGKNLHGNLHDIVTTHWQAAVRETELQETVEKTYQRLLGPTYAKTCEIRSWLHAQPQRDLILACLKDEKTKAK